MIRVIVAAALLASPALALAQKTVPPEENGRPRTEAAAPQSSTPPQRIRDVQVAPGQPCPKATADEVVVCRPLEDPYRIPKALRDSGPIPAQNQSWVNRAQTVDDVSRRAGGLPDTCSPIGSGGQTGCEMQQLQQWTDEQRAKRQSPDSQQ